LAGAKAPGGRLLTSSTRLFQAEQAAHWPAHLEETAPQVWQTKRAPSRAMTKFRFGCRQAYAQRLFLARADDQKDIGIVRVLFKAVSSPDPNGSPS
jgi:hypothetical protein